MFGTTVWDTATDLTTQFSDTVDDLQQLELTALGDEQLLSVLRELETQHRRLAAVDQRLIAEIESRGLAGQRACRSTAALLGQLLRISPAEASARLRAAADTGPARADRRDPAADLPAGRRRPSRRVDLGGARPDHHPHHRPVTGRGAGRLRPEPRGVSGRQRPGCSSRGYSPRSPAGSATPWTRTAPAAMRKTVSGAGSCGSGAAPTAPRVWRVS